MSTYLMMIFIICLCCVSLWISQSPYITPLFLILTFDNICIAFQKAFLPMKFEPHSEKAELVTPWQKSVGFMAEKPTHLC